jgi:beta-lactamase class D
MKNLVIALFFVSRVGCAWCADTVEVRELSREFGSCQGTFALYDAARSHWLRYRPDDGDVRTSPCSTFKVLNSLIALETGVASGPDFQIPWDGTHHEIEAWNRDQTLRSAFAVSCIWYFQALAARIGAERYHEFLGKVSYGNGDISGGLTQFWLESSLLISPNEQVEFLRRLGARQLPFSARTDGHGAGHHDSRASGLGCFSRQNRLGWRCQGWGDDGVVCGECDHS